MAILSKKLLGSNYILGSLLIKSRLRRNNLNPGDLVKIRSGVDQFSAKILESEKYRGAHILHYEFLLPTQIRGHKAYGVVFPEVPQLPPSMWLNQELYVCVAWIEWKGKLFPMPMRKEGRVIPSSIDPRLIMQRRVDLILDYVRRYFPNGSPEWEITPTNTWEYNEWKKLAQNSGEI